MQKTDFQAIISKIPEKYTSEIDGFLKRSIITERQFVRIMSKSFGINKDSQEAKVKSQTGRALMVLSFIETYDQQTSDSDELNMAIKRLMSNNGHETVNEIIAHLGLSNFFSNYKVTQLFEQLPDGFLDFPGMKILVEIKSRSPKVVDRLNYFYKSLGDFQWPVLEHSDLIIGMKIFEIDKKITVNQLNEEIKFVQLGMERLDYNNLSIYPQMVISRKTNYIKYAISLSSKPSKNEDHIGITRLESSSCIYLSKQVRPIENGLSGYNLFKVTLEDNIRELLSSILIDSCINNIKNLPDEPRLIAIYSDTLNDSYLKDFFTQKMKKYVSNKKGTCVIGIASSFIEENECIIYTAGIEAGADVEEFVKKVFFEPEAFT